MMKRMAGRLAIVLLLAGTHAAPAQKAPRNVTIEVRAVEISKNALRDIGVSWNVTVGRPAYPQFGAASGKFSVAADIKALETKKNARTHMVAQMTTIDGKPAALFVGNRTPFTVTTYSAFGFTQSIQFIDFGISIQALPEIMEDSKVKLGLKFNMTTIEPPPLVPVAGTIYPLFKTRSQESSVVARNGETLLIGRFYSDDERRNLSAVPGISTIPVIGELFKRQTRQRDEVELVLFVTPKISPE